MKKLNKKAMISPSENVAEQNVAIAAGGYSVYLLAAAVCAGLLLITGVVEKLGCSCRCQCGSDKKTMLAAQGYGNNARVMAR